MRRSDLGGRGGYKHKPLPDDFLRLPMDIAVRRYHAESREWGYLPVVELHRRVIMLMNRHHHHSPPRDSYTLVLSRDPTWGLGISVAESMGHVRVCSVSDRILRDHRHHHHHHRHGKVAIHKGDIVMGVNGLTCHEISPNELHRLRRIVTFIRTCPSPVVLHLETRSSTEAMRLSTTPGTTTTNITTPVSEASIRTVSSQTKTIFRLGNAKTLAQITERARQWQLFRSFLMDTKTFQLQTALGGSNTSVLLWGHRCLQDQWLQQRKEQQPPHEYYYTPPRSLTANNNHHGTVVVLPLLGVRKALSSRILHTFQDGDFTAFTIWVHDAETGREWYAPLRYFSDFQDLRDATSSIHDRIATISFPTPQGWSLFGSNESITHHLLDDSQRELQALQLEQFLQRLCTMIYMDDLQPTVAEVAVHVQSFLGCDSALENENTTNPSWSNMTITSTTTTSSITLDCVNCSWDGIQHSQLQVRTRLLLKRSLQMFTYRLLLLESVQTLVSQFVHAATRDNNPTLQDIEMMHKKSSIAVKEYSTKILDMIKAAVDQVQDLLLTTFANDYRAMAHCGLYTCIHEFMLGTRGESYYDRLVREAVREQVEIEVYLPLRSTASRLLVNAWRHEDAKVAWKLKVGAHTHTNKHKQTSCSN